MYYYEVVLTLTECFLILVCLMFLDLFCISNVLFYVTVSAHVLLKHS